MWMCAANPVKCQVKKLVRCAFSCGVGVHHKYLTMKEGTQLIAKTFHGLENVLANELTQLGAQRITVLNRAVSFANTQRLLYASNLHLRTALSVLQPIASFKARGPEGLYEEALRLDWANWFDHHRTISVTHSISSPYFNHSQYAALKLKDAICDYFRSKCDSRPSVDTDDADVRVNLHIFEDKVTISLDSSGQPLFKRGYRQRQTAAPMNEVLAAGIIKLTGWNCRSNFADPMCGSGTLPIEAAMLALDIAPGLLRNRFGFMHWRDFDPDLWHELLRQGRAQRKRDLDIKIVGADIDRDALSIAKGNAAFIRANALRFGARDFFSDFAPPEGPHGSVVVFNPPYGMRLQQEESSREFYRRVGAALKHRLVGCDVWMLAPRQDAVKEVHLHPSARIPLYNGNVECRLHHFKMYAGSLARPAAGETAAADAAAAGEEAGQGERVVGSRG